MDLSDRDLFFFLWLLPPPSPKMTTVNHGTYYAMKRVSKMHIVAKRQEEHMLFEKKILKAIQCDFIVRSPPPLTP